MRSSQNNDRHDPKLVIINAMAAYIAVLYEYQQVIGFLKATRYQHGYGYMK